MADTFTTNFGWTKPAVGSDTGTWGTLINADWDAVDSTVFTISGVANAALPTAGGTMTGALLGVVGSVSAPGYSFAGDTDTGLYWVGADSLAIICNGAAVLIASAGGVLAPGTLTVTGATTLNGALAANGKVSTTASTTGGAGLNVPQGTAPTSPSNGDVWTTSLGAFVQIAGSTFQFVNPSASGVTTFNTRAGAVTLTSGDVTTALGYTPENPASLGTAATVNTGTSGATIPLLNGNNTTSGNNTHSGSETFTGEAIIQAGIDLQTPLATMTATEAGYMGVPQNSQSGSYGIVAADRGKEVFFTASGTLTIPANASVAFPVGATIEISADVGATITVAITSDTLRFVPTNLTGSRTLVGPGTAVIQKKKSTEWWIKGDVS